MASANWENSSSDFSKNASYDDDDDEEEYSYIESKLQLRKDFSKARWNEEMGMAEVVEIKGKILTAVGIIRNGKIYCSIEETLFLVEIGALVLINHDNDDEHTLVPVPLSNIYNRVTCEKYGCCWQSFEAYRHLKSLGYIVGRHGVTWSMKSSTTSSSSSCEANSVIAKLKSASIREVRPLYDVYLPDSMFRKTNPGKPSFVLCSTGGCPPLKGGIEAIERMVNGIPLKFCHVEHGRTCYFCFNKGCSSAPRDVSMQLTRGNNCWKRF